MKNLKLLYDTNKDFQIYVDKFALCYHLDVMSALGYSLVQAVSESYELKSVQ